MRLQFLGTGGYHPNERRHTAGIMLPELGIVLDAGSSFFRVQPRLQTPELDVFITHPHLDHIQGLTYFLVPLLQGTVARCRVHADDVTLDAIRTHLFATSVFPVLPGYEFLTLSECVTVGNVSITHRPLKHPGGSRGYLLQTPKWRLAYITDTTVDGSYTEFIRGADILIHECYFPDELSQWCDPTGHSHTTQVAQLARDAGVGQLYLTHIDPQRPDDDPVGLETARRIFPRTLLAEDLMEIDLG